MIILIYLNSCGKDLTIWDKLTKNVIVCYYTNMDNGVRDGFKRIAQKGGNMKRTQFERFKSAILTAPKDDPIWWCGYLFIDLTEKQFATTKALLYSRADDFEITDEQITLPSGLGLRR